MAALPLRLSELARPHFDRLRDYHHELGGDLRLRRLDLAIARLLEQVCAFPGAYRPWRGAIRRITTPEFYLAIYYQTYADHILILAITDQRQDPRKLRL